jgi:hypothetical protein
MYIIVSNNANKRGYEAKRNHEQDGQECCDIIIFGNVEDPLFEKAVLLNNTKWRDNREHVTMEVSAYAFLRSC